MGFRDQQQPDRRSESNKATEEDGKGRADLPDYVQQAKDPETGETVNVLSMEDASDSDKLHEILSATVDDGSVRDYDRDRIEQTLRERRSYLQSLDVRDPALTAPAVFIGG